MSQSSKSILKPPSSRWSLAHGSDGSDRTEGSDSDNSFHRVFGEDHHRPDSISLHHVHFASDASIYLTHSTTEYDRTPVKVMKNPCAMPARGCPGLTYVPMNDGNGRQRGVRVLDAMPGPSTGPEEDLEESSRSEWDESEQSEYDGRENRDRPCQRYALRVSAQRRRRRLDEGLPNFNLGGFRSLSEISTLTNSPTDCLGGF